MEDISVTTQIAVLGMLLLVSAVFAMAETAMMACNRYRLRALHQSGHRGAGLALTLLGQTDKLLGVILLYNTLINAAIATLAGLVTVQLFGEEKWILGAGTVVVSLFILVFAEITPKVIGAAYPDQLTLAVSYVLTPILRLSNPVVSAVNVLVSGLLRMFRLRSASHASNLSMSPEELRTIVVESVVSVQPQHKNILLNLFDLERITVDDVMTPRGDMEAIDLKDSLDDIRQQIATSYHTRLPVHDGDPGNVIGILHQRRLLGRSLAGEWDRDDLRENLTAPYFIPSGTHVYSQLQFFQENRQRMGLVVDEYGEILGLLTLEDIIEEIIGKFTTSLNPAAETLRWEENGTAIVDGARSLRDLNRILALDFPLEGPKTLNGLILEHFQDIPESGISARVGGIPMEILQTQDRSVKSVKLFRPQPQT